MRIYPKLEELLKKLPPEYFFKVRFGQGLSRDARTWKQIKSFRELRSYYEKEGFSAATSLWSALASQNFRLTEGGTLALVRLYAEDLGLSKGMTFRGAISRRAREIGLLPCPPDTPFFAQMQTSRSFVDAGSARRNTLIFSDHAYMWKGKRKMLGLNTPLDFRYVTATPLHKGWECGFAFQIPEELVSGWMGEYNVRVPPRIWAI